MKLEPLDDDNTDTDAQMLDLVGNIVCSTKLNDYLTPTQIEELRAELTTAHARYSRVLSQPSWGRGGARFKCAEISSWRHGCSPFGARHPSAQPVQASQPKRDWVDLELPLLAELRWRYRMAWEAALVQRMAALRGPPSDGPDLAEARPPSLKIDTDGQRELFTAAH